MKFYDRRDLRLLIAVAVGGLIAFLAFIASWNEVPHEASAWWRQYYAEASFSTIVGCLWIGGLASVVTLVVFAHKNYNSQGILILVAKIALTVLGAVVMTGVMAFFLMEGHH